MDALKRVGFMFPELKTLLKVSAGGYVGLTLLALAIEPKAGVNYFEWTHIGARGVVAVVLDALCGHDGLDGDHRNHSLASPHAVGAVCIHETEADDPRGIDRGVSMHVNDSTRFGPYEQCARWHLLPPAISRCLVVCWHHDLAASLEHAPFFNVALGQSHRQHPHGSVFNHVADPGGCVLSRVVADF